ncbi:discoidin domain-containing protein [Prosthecobacter sp.]
MKNRIHILTGLALALTLASCGKKEESKAEGAAPAAAVPAGDLEEIKLDFPKPMFIGTPVPAELPNLEKPGTYKPILSIQVPKGTTNLAKGKKVSSSDAAPIIGDLTLVTDGDADGADGSFVELMPGKQWVQIDLEAPANIYKIAMWHYHKQAQAYIDVLVQVSDDVEFKTGVTTLWNSDNDDTSAMGKGGDPAYVETNHGRIIDGKGVKGRYVRLWSNGNTSNDMNHYCEVQVYGAAAK